MAKTVNKTNIGFPRLKRIKQKTDAHCGPAVLEMLVTFLGRRINQDKFVTAAEVAHKLKNHGMTITELGAAVSKLAPELTFWFKQHATAADLARVVNKYKYPVGVEWRGEFGKHSDGDDGHYSIVTHIDKKKKTIMLSDPFRVFAGTDRTFPLSQFVRKWWDDNLVFDSKAKRKRWIKDKRMMFLVTTKRTRFPKKLRMRPVVIH